MDVAKGFCILFVVLGHTSGWYMRNFTAGEYIVWDYVSTMFRPLRMPLFFLISGMLAASKMDRPLSDSWGKTAGLLVLCSIWTALFCVKLALPGGRDGLPYPPLEQVALAFLLPVQFWFIWALPVYYLIAWWLERAFGARSVYALAPMALLSLSSWWIGRATDGVMQPPFDPAHIQALCSNLLWFYLGCKGKAIWIDCVSRGNLRRFGVAIATYLILAGTALYFDAIEKVAVFLTPFALWAAMELLGCIDYTHPAARICDALGRQTLPIYVMHVFVLTAMTLVVRVLELDGVLPYESLAVQLGLPVLVGVGVVIFCRVVSSVLSGLPGLRYFVEPAPSPFAKSVRAVQRPLGVSNR